jgi:FkbM family methyltransferase
MIPTLRHYPPDADHVRAGIDIVLAGSYEPGADVAFDKPPRILDLGAHVGSASVFFARRFPGATIIAYEPHPTSAHYARLNTEGMNVEIVNAAVVGSGAGQVTLFEGKDNTGQRSVHQLGEQRSDGIAVRAIHASTLPPCDVLKMDTEGCELENLRAYRHLREVTVLMLEWHRQEDYHELLRWLPTLGFELRRDDARGAWVADRNLIFVRRREVMPDVESKTHPEGRNLGEDSPIWLVPRRDLNAILDLIPEYDLGAIPKLTAPRVLDVGAHVGGFAWYVLRHHPDARIQCFEAHPKTFELLKSNTKGLPVEAHHFAVVHPKKGPTVRLYEGLHGRQECSTRDDVRWPHCSQDLSRWLDVPAFDAAELPPADIVKVDTEGAEVAILSGYRHLQSARVLLVEPHAVGGDMEGQKREITALATRAGLRSIGGHILRFVR